MQPASQNPFAAARLTFYEDGAARSGDAARLFGQLPQRRRASGERVDLLASLASPPGDLPAALAGLAFGIINMALVAGVVALTARRSWWDTVREQYLWLLGHFVALGLFGLGLAEAWQAFGIMGLLVLLGPVALFAATLRSSVGRARPLRAPRPLPERREAA